MNLNEYQKQARSTAIYPKNATVIYPALKIAGEAGEVAELVGKAIRDDSGIIFEDGREKIKKELGDVLWYIANIACDLNIALEDIAITNIKKLADRKERNKLHGSGDNR